eukprot:2144652-Rhodomonas_salina.1
MGTRLKQWFLANVSNRLAGTKCAEKEGSRILEPFLCRTWVWTVLRACYAMSGTEMGYGATRSGSSPMAGSSTWVRAVT